MVYSSKKVALFSLSLVLLLLIFNETPGVEGKLCKYRSFHYTGRCTSNLVCAHVCEGEGAQGGHCKGWWKKRCMCQKQCGGGGGGGGGHPSPPGGGDEGGDDGGSGDGTDPLGRHTLGDQLW